MNLETLLEKLDIGESQDFECKRAEDNLPKDAWKTISAFANTEGGYIVLGVAEKKGKFQITGIHNPKKQLKDFWDNHNNTGKLSIPICNESDIAVEKVEDKSLIIIKVSKATRTQRPVYINNNPMTGTYKRNYEGDYPCTEDEIRQMFRDASSQPQDSQILENFDLNDIDSETMKAYRQRFSSREPDHPWLALDDKELLSQLGGWKRDRSTGKEGLTVAGLLMFGYERGILDAFSHYHLDYQERLSNDPEERWTYRVTLDGKWESNLFNFYYRVYGRLVTDLDVPFKLDRDAVRKEETHVHQALREALVNSIIHADHLSTRPLKIVKFQDLFIFSNPGRLRIPLERLYDGGESDPRNPNLQKMFQMLGLSEKAGSGFPKILRAWREQQWFRPLVSEKLDLDSIMVVLPMVSLIPEEIERELRTLVGEDYHYLSELDRIILVLAHRFGEISNSDIQCYSQKHPKDIGDCLKNLADKGWLDKSGRGRGTHYSLPTSENKNLLSLLQNTSNSQPSSDHLGESSDHLG
ncbi:putative transcriptional regulator with HTH domain, partial [Xenococcus sp. PCC 7305]|uniref:RNA-binding domain-containing protein n=1 Tax=Xenococcus sp. PCC 7305 TaxID=102125 RepID=UPI0002ABCA12